jgi:hypothetical protein
MQIGAVEVLREWLSRGEVGANNSGSFVMGLTHGFVGSWCSALQHRAEVVWCERHGFHHPIPWRRKVHSARWLLKAIAEIGRYVEPIDIQVGDYICLPRLLPYQGHAQRCSIRHGAGVVSVIDGNVGSYKRTQGRVRETGPIDLRRAELVGVARYY